MFTQAVALGVIPIGGSSEKHGDFAVVLDGDYDAREFALCILNEISGYARRDYTRAVCSAVEQLAKHLSWEGSAAYEIVGTNEDRIRLRAFTSLRLWRLPKRFVQIVPLNDWKTIGKKVIAVPSDRVWYIEMPARLGGKGHYRKVLRNLLKLEPTGPEFWRRDLVEGVQSLGFEYSQYQLMIDICCRKVTKRWGWNCQDWTQERTTEFFVFYRFVSLSLAQATLREHIIDALNQLFIRFGICCKIRVNGLPTSETIKRLRGEMVEGNISFNEIADQVRL